MARDTDRKKISEAIRLQGLWRVEARFPGAVVLKTVYDETLSIGYGVTDAIKYATYTHYDEFGTVVHREEITTGKRERVLHLINQGQGR